MNSEGIEKTGVGARMVEKGSDRHRMSDNVLSTAPLDDGDASAGTAFRDDGETNREAEAAKKDVTLTVQEQMERLAALNLSSASLSRSRFSPTVIRLLSAMAGVAALLVLYFCFKLFV